MAAGIVHFIYIVPSDKTLNNNYVTALGSLASTVQNFYTAQLNNGTSFSLHTPVVETFNSSQLASWFDANTVNSVDSNFAFINRTWNDLEAISSYTRSDGGHYVIFVDANTISSWAGGSIQGGSFSTIQNNPTGESGQNTLSQLARQNTSISNAIYGTSAHELGHNFNLVHAPDDGSIMAISTNHTFSNTQFIRASDLTNLRNNSFFQSGFVTGNNLSVSDPTAISESVSLNIAGSFQISVNNDSTVVSDSPVLGKYSISVSEITLVLDIGSDTSSIVMVISSVIAVENPVTVTDSIPTHYQDTITVTDSLSYYQDTVFMSDAIFMNAIGYGYQLDIENIKVQGLRIIGD